MFAADSLSSNCLLDRTPVFHRLGCFCLSVYSCTAAAAAAAPPSSTAAPPPPSPRLLLLLRRLLRLVRVLPLLTLANLLAQACLCNETVAWSLRVRRPKTTNQRAACVKLPGAQTAHSCRSMRGSTCHFRRRLRQKTEFFAGNLMGTQTSKRPQGCTVVVSQRGLSVQ